MKRGLVVLDPAEVPVDEWRQRVADLQRRLAEERVDLALVYGDVFASDDIAYLTNLCIYWNEGVLAVPATGEPVFLTKLSPRVHPWMRRVSTVTRIASGKQFGALAAKAAAELPGGGEPGTLGLIDAPLWPASVVAELRAALPGWQVRELPSWVREQRAVPSAAERALLAEAGRVVGRAVDAAVEDAAPAGTEGSSAPAAAAEGPGGRDRVATVERLVRGAGFLDVQVHTAHGLDGVECVQVTGQYRTLWVHAARLAGAAGSGWAAALGEAHEAALAAAREGACDADLEAAARPALDRLPEGSNAQVGWVDQTDLASGGEYRVRPAGTPLRAGSAVAVTVDALLPGGGYAALADTVFVTAQGARPLTRGCGTGALGDDGSHQHEQHDENDRHEQSTNRAAAPGGRSTQ